MVHLLVAVALAQEPASGPLYTQLHAYDTAPAFYLGLPLKSPDVKDLIKENRLEKVHGKELAYGGGGLCVMFTSDATIQAFDFNHVLDGSVCPVEEGAEVALPWDFVLGVTSAQVRAKLGQPAPRFDSTQRDDTVDLWVDDQSNSDNRYREYPIFVRAEFHDDRLTGLAVGDQIAILPESTVLQWWKAHPGEGRLWGKIVSMADAGSAPSASPDLLALDFSAFKWGASPNSSKPATPPPAPAPPPPTPAAQPVSPDVLALDFSAFKWGASPNSSPPVPPPPPPAPPPPAPADDDEVTDAVTPAASDANSEVPAFVAELKEWAAGTGGFTIVSDDRYGLESGYTAFAAYLKPGVALHVTIVAPSTTPFTAKIRHPSGEEIHFTQAVGFSRGLFVMGLTVRTWDLGGEAQVVVLPNGGDFGDVRVVQMERPNP